MQNLDPNELQSSTKVATPGADASDGAPCCNLAEHRVSRRLFLGGFAAGMFGTGVLFQPLMARELKARAKRILLVFQHGGLSQLESWDPKPGTDTGGPFRTIPTSVPGVHISELMPLTARQVHRLVLLRGLNTGDANHDSARVTMLTGWKQGLVGGEYPSMGAICTKLLAKGRPRPSYIVLTNRDQWHLASRIDASYLGPRYAPVVAFDEKPPDNLADPDAGSAARRKRRTELRRLLGERSRGQFRLPEEEAYDQTFKTAAELIEKQKLFDLSEVSPRDHDRYGRHEFGQRCLIARKLLEEECTFVKLNHGNYDTHFENFNHHLHRLDEFDRPFAALLQDIADRGLLESTLVIVTGEFGRTPKINSSIGRDHWADSWSLAMAGCGLQAGAVYGKTSANGTEVTDGEVKFGDLFHTFYTALGLDPKKHLRDGDRPVPVTDPDGSPIQEVLA